MKAEKYGVELVLFICSFQIRALLLLDSESSLL